MQDKPPALDWLLFFFWTTVCEALVFPAVLDGLNGAEDSPNGRSVAAGALSWLCRVVLFPLELAAHVVTLIAYFCAIYFIVLYGFLLITGIAVAGFEFLNGR